MIWLSDIESVLRIPSSDVVDGCSYIEFDWRRTSSRYNDIGHGPKVYRDGDYWVPYGLLDYLKSLMFTKFWSVLEVYGAIYRMYDSEGTLLAPAVDLFEKDFDVQYNERPVQLANNMSAGDFVESYMLHSDKVGWITPGLRFTPLSGGIYGVSGNSVTYLYKDGSTEEVWPPSEILFDEDKVSAHIQLRDRSMDVVFINEPAVIFCFRNIFNREEEISIPGILSCSPSSDLDVGLSGKTLVKYGVRHSREYTLKTGILPAFMYRTIMEMCRSRRVRLGHGGPDIVIEKFKFPRSTSPNSPVSLELTFRYADTTRDSSVNVE